MQCIVVDESSSLSVSTQQSTGHFSELPKALVHPSTQLCSAQWHDINVNRVHPSPPISLSILSIDVEQPLQAMPFPCWDVVPLLGTCFAIDSIGTAHNIRCSREPIPDWSIFVTIQSNSEQFNRTCQHLRVKLYFQSCCLMILSFTFQNCIEVFQPAPLERFSLYNHDVAICYIRYCMLLVCSHAQTNFLFTTSCISTKIFICLIICSSRMFHLRLNLPANLNLQSCTGSSSQTPSIKPISCKRYLSSICIILYWGLSTDNINSTDAVQLQILTKIIDIAIIIVLKRSVVICTI